MGERNRKTNFANLSKEIKEIPSVSAVMHPHQGSHFFDYYDSFVKIFSNLEKPKD